MELLGWIDGFMGRRSGFTFCKYEGRNKIQSSQLFEFHQAVM
jgi:hypothetical protein